jgi:hypothetical protein
MPPAAIFAPVDAINPLLAAGSYLIDAAQRWVLFWDVLRQRGNQYLEHLAQGQPPVLVFDYETILDGRSLERPVNYALARILDRRCRPQPQKPDAVRPQEDACGRGALRHERRHPLGAEPQRSNPRPSSSSSRAPGTARASAAPSRIRRSAWPWMPGIPFIS